MHFSGKEWMISSLWWANEHGCHSVSSQVSNCCSSGFLFECELFWFSPAHCFMNNNIFFAIAACQVWAIIWNRTTLQFSSPTLPSTSHVPPAWQVACSWGCTQHTWHTSQRASLWRTRLHSVCTSWQVVCSRPFWHPSTSTAGLEYAPGQSGGSWAALCRRWWSHGWGLGNWLLLLVHTCTYCFVELQVQCRIYTSTYQYISVHTCKHSKQTLYRQGEIYWAGDV